MILLQLHEKLPKNSMSTILWSFGIWSKLERWEMSISGCLISWLQIKKIILKCLLLLFYATTMNHFSIGLWHAMKIGFYMVMTSSAVGPRRSSKALLKVKFATTTTMKRSLFSGLLLVWFITAFWNLGEITTSEKYAQQTDERHWKLQYLQLALGLKGHSSAPRQRPTAHPTTSTSKVLHFCFIHYIHLTNYHFFKHLDNFLQGKCFHNQQEAKKCFPRVLQSQNMDFHATQINQLISHRQKCVDCNGSYFD